MFHDSLGVFKGRIKESLNPIYWIEFLIHLPKNILLYFDIPSKSILIKITQIFYWVIMTLCTAFTRLYPQESDLLFKKVLNLFMTI